MAVAPLARGAARRGGQRTALFLVFALGGVVLVSLLSRAVPLPSHSAGLLIEDEATAASLYQLAKSSVNASDFAARLKAVGLMAQPEGEPRSAGADSAADGDVDAGTSAHTQAVAVKKKGKGDGTAAAGKGGGGRVAVPQLSRELAYKHARDGIIIVTWANFHFFDFVLNWVHHMELHGITNYIVGAMDAETGQALAKRGLNVFAMYDEQAGKADTGLGSGDFGWGSPLFHKMGRQKVDLARTFTDFGLDLCLCDVDTVWINDPTEYFERYPDADILASSDDLRPSNPKGDDGLEQLEAIHSAMNIGLLFFRHSKNTTRFIDAWQQQLDADAKAWDQDIFNRVAHVDLLPFQPLEKQPRLVWGANHSLVFGVLPVASFASGHTFFVQRLFEFQQVKPYVVHTTYQYGGTAGKRHRLREAMLWVDPPEYYSDGLFLSVDLKYPATPKDYQLQNETMMEGIRFKTDWKQDDMVELHLSNMRQQLAQLKTALQLAVALNRTIIMPKLLAWCDRYWVPLEFCQVPGAFNTRLPFVAPMDHILEPYNFDDLAIGDKAAIQFREYSFLMNERTPKSLQETRVVVTPTAGAAAAVEKVVKGRKQVVLPQKLNDAALRQALAPYRDVQLLHFSSLDGAFGGWEQREMQDAFQSRILHMMGFFCCKQVKEGEDGGVSYAPFVADKS